ncbi:MBL fold metallo-hydrolase [Aureimonas sp. AU4]|uniref:MBL fold metallo-hydrolase n=1 Tax=Aureimonas sp. AU4 TaxID=1638163 RepID=UPI000780F3B9|nr:MBL fold metallo-hydrolase [Aureimonas sp. AU4]
MSLPLELQFEPRHGDAVPVAPGVHRVTARNAGPMTFHGTNTYLVGSDDLVVIDPGPSDDRHLEALLAAIANRPVTAIVLTHGHLDHSALARSLQRNVDAPILASAAYAGSKDGDLADHQVLSLGSATFEVVATPGHTADHVAFALRGASLLFSGDHVMAWSTTVIAPPDGRMSDYMASLDRLMPRRETRYLPGHGGPVERPQVLLRALRTHRRMREAAILNRLATGPAEAGAITADLYRGIEPALRKAATLSVLAHLEDLTEKRRVTRLGEVFALVDEPATPPV